MSSFFGKTWWGQQWLKSLSRIDHSNRLPRGSSYARKEAVEKISIHDNSIRAKVAGSRPKPYDVEIIIPLFPGNQRKSFIQRIAEKPAIISKLLNRELDSEILQIAKQSGLIVFPEKWSDFNMNCSCPDWAVPCKHLAAVIYKVSAEIDNNPFLIFELHGMDLIQEFNNMGIVVERSQTDIKNAIDLYVQKKPSELKSFQEESAFQKIVFSQLYPIHEPLAALLADSPPFYIGKSDFKEDYCKKIKKLANHAQRILSGKIEFTDFNGFSPVSKEKLTHHSILSISIDEHNNACMYFDEHTAKVEELFSQLFAISGSYIKDYQMEVASMHSAFFLAMHLLANGAIIPQIIRFPKDTYFIRWLPAQISSEVRSLVSKLDDILPNEILYWETNTGYKEIYQEKALNILSIWLTELIKFFNAEKDHDLFVSMFFNIRAYSFNKPGEASLKEGIAVWLKKYFITQGIFRPHIMVEELPRNRFKVGILISDQNRGNKPKSLELLLSQDEYLRNKIEILQVLAHLTSFIPHLDKHINSGGKEMITMSSNEFGKFLFEVIPAIQLLDIEVLLPKSLQSILRPRPSIKVKKNKGKSFLQLGELLSFDWQVAVGDELMSEEEFHQLSLKSNSLLKFKSKYIYVDQSDLIKIQKHFGNSKGLNPFQILQTAISGEYQGAKASLTEEVQALIQELTSVETIQIPQNLNATLRPYQHRGFSWLYRNAKIGFGSVLADDMGLGKTLQVITAILKFKEEQMLESEKILVVAPTGLITNWEAEFEKFAPSIQVKVYHGNKRTLSNEDRFDVLITSYGIVRSDVLTLKKTKWHSLIIDEAQNIKNVGTEQTKAIKSLKAKNNIAMSGTPVENRLSELWSIMDYSNRGFLGNQKEFHENFGQPIEIQNDKSAAERLKKVTGPFLMRRLKTDKTIISDLPDKIEMDSFCNLTKSQAALYKKTLDAAMEVIEGISGNDHQSLFKRQGLVLQMILGLKQICNHPTQFLKNKNFDVTLSGKMDLLFEKLDVIVDAGEKVLVFTQFKEMGTMLHEFITERYGEVPLFYHGGCTLKERKTMVENFQTNRTDKIFILSLKAAGTGLNLTAANHVIHFDLWWNPAVEAQATDRAYRIGQKSNVMVHRFITKDTFEEKINQMIQGKKALADLTVATGENWIGNLSNKELRQLFE